MLRVSAIKGKLYSDLNYKIGKNVGGFTNVIRLEISTFRDKCT